MARRRKTQAGRDRERAAANSRAWEEFRTQVAALRSHLDAKRLVAYRSPVDSPGHHYFSNFEVFFMTFTIPGGASYEEKELSLQFIQRLDAAGGWKPGEAKKVEEKLRQAMKAERPSQTP